MLHLIRVRVPIFLKKVSNFNLFIISFFTFPGFYFAIALLIAGGLEPFSRLVTIPLRLVVSILSVLYILYKGVSRKIYSLHSLIFFVFSTLYISRILNELIQAHNNYHQPTFDFFLYFISFGIIPFVLFLNIKKDDSYKSIFMGIFISSILFSLLSLYLYGSVIQANFGRINSTNSLSNAQNFSAINPLALGYSGALLIGLSIWRLFLLADIKKNNNWIYYITFFIGLTPLYLGSSRGSFVALVISLLTFILFTKGYIKTYKSLFYVIIGIVCIYFISSYTGSILFKRLFDISKNVDEVTSSAARLIYWEKGLLQFARHPIFGNSLELTFAKFHPHNIFIESLITTGLFGFLALLSLIIMTFKKSIKIIQHRQELGWVVIIFFQAITQYMFSGSIYGAIWLWSSIGLVISVDLKRRSWNSKNKFMN